MAGVPRLLAIMGSGETSPTMTKVHRQLLERLGPPPVKAVLLDTPYRFQNNASDVSTRVAAYFRESVGQDISVAAQPPHDDLVAHERMLNSVRQASYAFSGPGSPSYALRHWRGTQLPVVLSEKLRRGGCVTFASAAAVTLGPVALPVYEIYKVGEPPHWLEGLDLMGELGLKAAVIPHFDNAEGGSYDTRFCYMGEERLALLEELLPEGVFVLGVDEHTACIFDLDAGTVAVTGRGSLTVRRSGTATRVDSGQSLSLDELRGLAAGTGGDDGTSGPGPTPAVAEAPPARSPLLDAVAALQAEFDSAFEAEDAQGSLRSALNLGDLLLDWSRDLTQSDEMDRAQAALRSMMARLAEAAEAGLRPQRQQLEPLVDALLEVRDRARAEARWEQADTIRDRLAEAGVEIRDSPEGTRWTSADGGRR